MTKHFFIVFAVLGALGCDEAEHHPSAEQQLKAGSVSGPVVALVGGRKIGQEDFEAFWRSNPELAREEAIQAMVDQELLLALALRHGVNGDPRELVFSRKRAMVRLALHEVVEKGNNSLEAREGALDTLLAGQRTASEVVIDPSVIEVQFELMSK